MPDAFLADMRQRGFEINVHDLNHGGRLFGSREVFVLRYTYDERVEDGFYAARALERLQALLEEPERLTLELWTHTGGSR